MQPSTKVLGAPRRIACACITIMSMVAGLVEGCPCALMGSVLLAALYGLAASGHFPAEFRPKKLQRGWGALVLWGTMIATGLAGTSVLVLAWRALPWYATVIGGGAALLFAPLLLQPLP